MRERVREREGGDGRERHDGRGQLSLSVVEAGVGVLLLVAVTTGFALSLPDPATERAQLDVYADDAATVLVGEAPRHGASSRLAEVAHSPASFARERAALERRVERILPANLLFRVVTPHGAVGFPRPDGVVFGSTRVVTPGGAVTIWVWYT